MSLTHADHVAELKAQIEAHPDLPLVIEGDDGIGYELTDCSLENVAVEGGEAGGRDQILVKIART